VQNINVLIGILCVITVGIIGSIIWWNSSSLITNIAPSEVSKIEIFNGNTGKSITIKDTTDINHIITNLNEISLKKEKISLGYMGYSYRTTIYNSNGNIYKKFIINSSNTIRKDPFFYRDSSESIDYGYIQKLFNEDIKQ
jgi:hypothetical protein